jgi:hypothetical protein
MLLEVAQGKPGKWIIWKKSGASLALAEVYDSEAAALRRAFDSLNKLFDPIVSAEGARPPHQPPAPK